MWHFLILSGCFIFSLMRRSWRKMKTITERRRSRLTEASFSTKLVSECMCLCSHIVILWNHFISWAQHFVVWWWQTCSWTLEYMDFLIKHTTIESNQHFAGILNLRIILPMKYIKLNVQRIKIILQYSCHSNCHGHWTFVWNDSSQELASFLFNFKQEVIISQMRGHVYKHRHNPVNMMKTRNSPLKDWGKLVCSTKDQSFFCLNAVILKPIVLTIL